MNLGRASYPSSIDEVSFSILHIIVSQKYNKINYKQNKKQAKMNNAQEYAEQQVRALGVNPNYSMHERMRLKEFTGYDLRDAYMAGYDKAVY